MYKMTYILKSCESVASLVVVLVVVVLVLVVMDNNGFLKYL